MTIKSHHIHKVSHFCRIADPRPQAEPNCSARWIPHGIPWHIECRANRVSTRPTLRSRQAHPAVPSDPVPGATHTPEYHICLSLDNHHCLARPRCAMLQNRSDGDQRWAYLTTCLGPLAASRLQQRTRSPRRHVRLLTLLVRARRAESVKS
jgi:hypothetical protein